MALSFEDARQRARLGRFDFSRDGNSELAMGFGADNRTELARLQAAANRSGFTGQSDAELGQLFASEAQKDPNARNPMFGGVSFTDIQGYGGGFNATDFGRSFQAAMDSFNNPVATGGTGGTGDTGGAGGTGTTGNTGGTVTQPLPPPPGGTGGGGNDTPPGGNPAVDLGPLPTVNRDGGMGEVGSSITLFREMLKRGQTPDAAQVSYISQLADRAGLSGEAILKEFTNLPPMSAQAAGASASAQNSLSSVGNAGGPSIAQTIPVGGSSDAMLRAQQQTLTRDSILKGEQFGQQAIESLNPFNVTQSGISFTTPNEQAQQVNLADYNPNITGGQDATYNVSQYEQDLQQALLGRVNNYGQGANNPYAQSLLADVENTAARQREADVTALNKYGVLNSGDTIDVFAQGNEGTQRSRLAALAQAQQYAQNDGSLEAALGLAQLGSNRDLDIGALTGRFGGIDTLAARNSQADFGLRGREQDLTAGLANQSSDLTAQGMNQAQELGIADRRLIDAERLSGDQRFSSDLGLRQLTAQQDLADRVTSRQLIQGSPTGRETFEEGVRAQLANEGLQGRSLDETVNARIASLQNQLDLQDRVNSGSLANTTQQGTNQYSLQQLLNSGSLDQIGAQGRSNVAQMSAQGSNDRLLQNIVGQQNLDAIAAQNTGAESLQRILGQQALSQLATGGSNDRLLQSLINSGAVQNTAQAGSDAAALARIQNMGANALQQTTNAGNLAVTNANNTSQQALQGLINSGALDQLTRQGEQQRLGQTNQGFQDRLLQNILGTQATDQLQEQGNQNRLTSSQQGLNDRLLQTMLNSGALDQIGAQGNQNRLTSSQQGLNDRLLQTMLNSGALDQIVAQGTNQTNLQNLINQYSGELATGFYDGKQTLDGMFANQQFDFNNQTNPLTLDSMNIANNDAASMTDERRFGQLVALLNAAKGDETLLGALPDDLNQTISSSFDRLMGLQSPGGPRQSRQIAQGEGLSRFYQANESFGPANTAVVGNELRSKATGALIARWNAATNTWEKG